MNLRPSPDIGPLPEELPLRHRESRARDAEKIRQEFIKSQRKIHLQKSARSAKEFSENEQ